MGYSQQVHVVVVVGAICAPKHDALRRVTTALLCAHLSCNEQRQLAELLGDQKFTGYVVQGEQRLCTPPLLHTRLIGRVQAHSRSYLCFVQRPVGLCTAKQQQCQSGDIVGKYNQFHHKDGVTHHGVPVSSSREVTLHICV